MKRQNLLLFALAIFIFNSLPVAAWNYCPMPCYTPPCHNACGGGHTPNPPTPPTPPAPPVTPPAPPITPPVTPLIIPVTPPNPPVNPPTTPTNPNTPIPPTSGPIVPTDVTRVPVFGVPGDLVNGVLAGMNQTFVSTNNCTAVYFEELPRTYIQAEEGTILHLNQNKSLDVQGQIFAGAGTKGLNINAGNGQANVSPDAIVTVATEGNGAVSIIVLDPGQGRVSFELNGHSYKVNEAGKELVVGPKKLTGQELTNEDGIGRSESTISVDPSGNYATLSNISVGEAMEVNPLLMCHYQPNKFAWPFNKIQQQQGIAAKSQPQAYKPSPNALSTNNLRPISYVKENIEEETIFNFPHNLAGKLEEVSPGHFKFDRGIVLVNAGQFTEIELPNGVLTLKPGSAAVLSSDPASTRIMDVHDRSAQSISLKVEGKEFNLSPGREISILHSDNVDGKRLVKQFGISRRMMRIVTVGNDQQKLVLNHFSLYDAMRRHPLLNDLHYSESAKDRQLWSSMMKITAALIAMHGGTAF